MFLSSWLMDDRSCRSSWQCTMFLSGRMFLYVNTNIVLIYSLILVWLVANLLPHQWIVLVVSIMTLDHCWQTLYLIHDWLDDYYISQSTRWHIVYATQHLSQFIPHPTKPQQKASTLVLCYLKSCPGKGLLFCRDSPLQICGFSDVDWATCIDSCRSITAYCFFLWNSSILWKTKKHNIMFLSSFEVEYRALASTTCELQCLSYLLHDLKVTCSKPVVRFCDNQRALHIIINEIATSFLLPSTNWHFH